MYHSHITGDIIGYAHSYCNLKFRENEDQISVIAHELFGFDFFFLLKRHKASVLENLKYFHRRYKSCKHKFYKHS